MEYLHKKFNPYDSGRIGEILQMIIQNVTSWIKNILTFKYDSIITKKSVLIQLAAYC